MSDAALAWFRAQLDDDERVARAATSGPWRYDPTKHHRLPGTVRFEEGVFTGPPGADAVCIAVTGETDDPQSMADAEHIATWDPARVLAEIEAKRRILAHIGMVVISPGREALPPEYVEQMELFCKWIAQPYADRPGFPEEWR